MTLLTVATCLWDANERSLPTSRCYDETWVNKLAAMARRNLTVPHRFVCFTDRTRRFDAGIEQERLTAARPDYGSFTEPYCLNAPMILMGLDTVIVGNIDPMAHYCLTAPKIALPRDPYQPDRVINAVALVPAGHRALWDDWRGENDMDWLRSRDTTFLDDLFPGAVLSLKFHDIRRKGLQGARIVYMHGQHKPHQLLHLPWVREHWRT